jgi:hypothetical protein
MANVAQITQEAIDESKARDKIAYIISGGGVSQDDLRAAHEEMLAECEDSADVGGYVEYWGKDCEGVEWRVHVEVAS